MDSTLQRLRAVCAATARLLSKFFHQHTTGKEQKYSASVNKTTLSDFQLLQANRYNFI